LFFSEKNNKNQLKAKLILVLVFYGCIYFSATLLLSGDYKNTHHSDYQKINVV